jgi:23S rRNA-/tRNA-specific pseudouridylate synthase
MNIRLDVYLQRHLEEVTGVKLSRAYIERLLDAGAVTYNDEVVKKKGFSFNDEKQLPIIDMKEVQKINEVYQTGKRQDSEATKWDASEEGIELDEERIEAAADLAPRIVYEDTNIVVVNKPPGVSSHPGKGDRGADSMVYQFIKYMRKEHQYVPRAGLLHRLDKDTQGILLFAKNMQTYNEVKAQFETKGIQKYYRAVCQKTPRMNNSLRRLLAEYRKNPPEEVTGMLTKQKVEHIMETQKPLEMEGYIGRQKGNEFMVYSPDRREAGPLVGVKDCSSDVYILKDNEFSVELLFVPHTGRTHQIRAQARYLGVPVTNDRIYGPNRTPQGILGLTAVGIVFALKGETKEFFLK